MKAVAMAVIVALLAGGTLNKTPEGVPEEYWGYFQEYATEDIPAELLAGVAKVESDFNPNCVTGVCYGIMQLHSKYEFDRLDGKSWRDPEANIKACAELLNELYDRYGSIDKTLMVYNEGWSGDRSGTSKYSRKVRKWADKYSER